MTPPPLHRRGTHVRVPQACPAKSRAVCGKLAAGSTSANERQERTILAELGHLMYDLIGAAALPAL